MALFECWIQECAQAEQHWLPIQVFHHVVLKGGALGSGGGDSGLIHIIIKQVHPSMCRFFLLCLVLEENHCVSVLVILNWQCCASSVHSSKAKKTKKTKQNKKNINQMLSSLETVYLWSIFSKKSRSLFRDLSRCNQEWELKTFNQIIYP